MDQIIRGLAQFPSCRASLAAYTAAHIIAGVLMAGIAWYYLQDKDSIR